MQQKERLKEVLGVQSYSHNQFRMFAYIIRQLQDIDCTYQTYNGSIYVTKGDQKFFPCVVAHMDTVHRIKEHYQVMEAGGNYFAYDKSRMEQTGIGGDDKIGIYITLEMLRNNNNIKVAFFRDEETGCEGSYDPLISFFDNCGFVLQCDRRDYGDFITSASGVKLSGKGFQEAIKPIIGLYGYTFTSGMMTDVMALKESGIKCAMANMSCGYYRPHMDDEYVNIQQVLWVEDMVQEIITALNGKLFTQPYNKPTFKGNYGYYNTRTGKWKEWGYTPDATTDDSPFDGGIDTYTKDYSGRGAWMDGDSDIEEEGQLAGVCECCNLYHDKLSYIRDWNCDLCDTCITDYVLPYEHKPIK